MKTLNVTLSAPIPHNMAETIDALAAKLGLKRTEVIRRLLKEALISYEGVENVP